MNQLWKISLSIVLVAFCSFIFPQSSSGQKAKYKRSENGVQNQYIVTLKEGYLDSFAKGPSIESSAQYLSHVYGGRIKQSYQSAISGYVSQMTERQAMRLSMDERVAFVEQDAYTTIEGSQGNATWGLDRIDQRTLPLNGQFTYGPDASNVHAYVIDTGIRITHADFGGRATTDYDLYNDGNLDCNGHGTHVAGTIGGATWGVAKNVRLHSVRVMGCTTSGTVSELIGGIDWVKQYHQSPAVANISITASSVVNSLDNAVRALIQSGVTVAVAAGNYNSDACNFSPASAANAITVGAVGGSDNKAGFSNYGSCVDVWAPGAGITSASNADDFSSRLMGGTSMASPHVAGVAALYLAGNPTASPSTVTQSLVNNASSGSLTGLDASSPNKLVYSWLDGTPSLPAAARVTVRKRAISRTESTPSTTFSFNATNLAASTFALQTENQFTDSNVTEFGSSNMITVTEAQAWGWQLTSITCTETSGGTPNLVNTTVDLVNRRASIIAEEGEQIDCTFTSEELSPSAATATISGRIITEDGRGFRGVMVSLLDASTGELRTATTNTFGYYSFTNLSVSDFFVVTAYAPRLYRIDNNVQAFSLEDNLELPAFVVRR